MASRRPPRLFDEDRSGFAFREVFTPLREGPLPPRPGPRPPGKGGSLYDLAMGGGKPPGGAKSVWSAADAAANAMTLSNGGLTVTPSATGSWQSIRSSISKTSGKLYIEFSTSSAANNDVAFGFADSSFVTTAELGSSGVSFGLQSYGGMTATTGFNDNYGLGITPAANDVWAMAVDFAAGSVWVAQNNVWFAPGNPATGANPMVSIVPPATGHALFPGMSFQNASHGVWTIQATAASQKYLPPPGFQAWDGGPVTPPPSNVWSAADAAANGMTLSNGGLTVTGSGGSWVSSRTTTSKTSGKLYVEFLSVNFPGNWSFWGLASSGFNAASYLSTSNYSGGIYMGNSVLVSTGFTSNSPNVAPPFPPAVGDVWALAVDFAAGNVWLAQNNTWISGNPATGAGPAMSFVPATVGALFPAISIENAPAPIWTLQATAASQKYAPPAGFSAWG